jgi:hypothetical protein
MANVDGPSAALEMHEFQEAAYAPPRSHSLEIRRTKGIAPALEDPGGVDANHAITLVEICSVALEPASGSVLTSTRRCGAAV